MGVCKAEGIVVTHLSDDRKDAFHCAAAYRRLRIICLCNYRGNCVIKYSHYCVKEKKKAFCWFAVVFLSACSPTISIAQVGTDVATLPSVERRLDIDDAFLGTVKDSRGVLTHQCCHETCAGKDECIQGPNSKINCGEIIALNIHICVISLPS